MPISLAELFAVDGRPVTLPGSDEWHNWFAVAAKEVVLPSLWSRLQTIGLASGIPGEVAEALQTIQQLNAERNEEIISQARDLVARLNEKGIEPVALKGLAYLVIGIYSEPSARYLLDLDFLIPREQMTTAIEAVAAAGYEADSDDPFIAARHHAPRMQRLGCAPVELHHSLAIGSDAAILPAREVLASSQRMTWRGVILRVPSPEHLATHLVLHSQIQHCYGERIWPPLRAMIDLTQLDGRFGEELCWDTIARRFQSCGHSGAFNLHILHVHEVLGMPMPFVPRLNWLTRLRGMRRVALNRAPRLRYVDVVYLFCALFLRRLRLLRALCFVPYGRGAK